MDNRVNFLLLAISFGFIYHERSLIHAQYRIDMNMVKNSINSIVIHLGLKDFFIFHVFTKYQYSTSEEVQNII